MPGMLLAIIFLQISTELYGPLFKETMVMVLLNLPPAIVAIADQAEVLPFGPGRAPVTDPLLIEKVRKTSSPSINAAVAEISGLMFFA